MARKTVKALLARLVGLAIASIAPVCFAEAGAPGCVDSGSCGPPTPYCHPTLQACVQCLTTKNCPAALICEVGTGACVPCRTDGDCTAERPYCDAEAGCVQCKSNENCAAEGLLCAEGTCGSCGDGTCSGRERVVNVDFFSESSDLDVCTEDCQAKCSTDTMEAGQTVTVRIGDRNLYQTWCGAESAEGLDTSIAFTARAPGIHTVTVTRHGSGDSPFSAGVLMGDCPGEYLFDCAVVAEPRPLRLKLTQGQAATILVEGAASEEFDVMVVEPPPCVGPSCPAGADAGDAASATCKEAARARGDAPCDGVTCACDACPRDYDDCQIIPGCKAMSECMLTAECTGEACRTGGDCAQVIDTHGGLRGAAFRAASALQACSRASSCALPCPIVGVDAGAAPDAGVRACRPGERQTCTCEAGTGERRCSDDGSAYGPCRCAPAAEPASESSCDCGLSRAPGSIAGWGSLLGFAAAAARRVRRQRSRKGRR